MRQLTLPITSKVVLTPEQLEAVGCVAIESTYCELVLGTILSSVLKVSFDVGEIVTAGMSIDVKADTLKRIAEKQLTGEILQELCEVIAKIRSANTQRNIIIHGEWTTPVNNYLALLRDGPEKYPPAFAKKSNKSGKVQMFSANDVMATAIAISSARAELLEVCCRAWPEAWLEIRL